MAKRVEKTGKKERYFLHSIFGKSQKNPLQ